MLAMLYVLIQNPVLTLGYLATAKSGVIVGVLNLIVLGIRCCYTM